MFQNVAEFGKQKDNIIEKSEKVRIRLEEIFKYQNIIIYILTFLISTLSIKKEIMPFGLAMVAACVGSEVPVIGVFISALVGTAVGNGIASVGNFIITSIIYFLLVLIFRTNVAVEERNEVVKSGGKLFSAILIVSIVKSFMGIFLMYDVFMGIVSGAIAYSFYKIFVNGVVSIRDFKNKSAYTIEELVATIIIVALASCIFKGLNIFSLNISNIIIIFMIMVLGWKHGMLVGALAGTSIGLAIALVDGTSFVQISMFAISGILSGILNRFGKLGVIIGFILGNAILTYWVRGASTTVLYFREIFIASIGLMLVPNKFKITIEDLVGSNKLIADIGERRLGTTNVEVSEKLKVISGLFDEMLNTHQEKKTYSDDLVCDFLNNLEDCKDNLFYSEISNKENNIAKDICVQLENKEVISEKDFVNVLKSHNNYIYTQDSTISKDMSQIVELANKTYKIFQINLVKEKEHQNTIKELNTNLKSAAKVINDCANEIVKTVENEYSKKEQEVIVVLKNKNFKIYNCNIKKIKNGKFIVELKLEYTDIRVREKEVITNISDIISKCIGTKVTMQRERVDDEKQEYYQVYSSEDKFILQVGCSRIAKDNSEVSGDCSLQIKLADGKYLLAISDGMGSGEKAREYSKLTLRLIKQMLVAGFDKEESVKLINSRINTLGCSKRYSTLDVSILDLYAGNIEFLKSAACTSYIKNKKNITKIQAESLPIGIVEDIEVSSSSISISDGDILVMCSDGIMDSKENDGKEWLEEFLKNVSTNNVQKLADLILAEAIDNTYGVAQDDMTVIVSKIVKRK